AHNACATETAVISESAEDNISLSPANLQTLFFTEDHGNGLVLLFSCLFCFLLHLRRSFLIRSSSSSKVNTAVRFLLCSLRGSVSITGVVEGGSYNNLSNSLSVFTSSCI